MQGELRLRRGRGFGSSRRSRDFAAPSLEPILVLQGKRAFASSISDPFWILPAMEMGRILSRCRTAVFKSRRLPSESYSRSCAAALACSDALRLLSVGHRGVYHGV